VDATTGTPLLQGELAMQITKKELIEIINEEIKDMIENDDIDEGVLDRMKAGAAGLGSGLKSKVAGAFGADTTDIDATQALKKASSLMKSYDKQLLKLAQSLKMDAAKMGIEDQTAKVQQAINQTRTQVQQIAKDAPTTARMQRMDQQRAQQQGQQQAAPAQQQQAAPAQQQQAAPAQQQQAAAQPATPSAEPAAAQPAAQPAAAPAAAEPAAAEPAPAAEPAAAPAASGRRQLSQNPRNVRRRERRAAETPEEREARLVRQRASRAARSRRNAGNTAAAARPSRAAQQQNESKVKKGETLNEQLQEISRRWGFDK
jgi:hypothetical protein